MRKGKSVDAKQIGRDLGVRYVLEGSVRRTGDRLGFFASTPFRWLLVRAAQLHFAKRALALHLFLQHAERRVCIVVANKDFHFPYLPKSTRPPVHRPDTMGAALRPTPAS